MFIVNSGGQKQKGFVLLMVIGLSLAISIGIASLLFFLRSNVRNIEAFEERARAYYLCETGASLAILDIAHGKIGTGEGQWTERTFNYSVGDKAYPIRYRVTKSAGQWMILAWVDASSGFSRTYKLRVGGRRAFPIFIRGFSGG